ncbi:MAG: thioredoxin-dependent thiol peroxidase [Patescibacteria group bacterium]
MKAPSFSLTDQDNKVHTLHDYKGRWVILYFYPKDNTPGCIREACGFRDKLDELKKKNIAVLGVSRDSVASHRKFADQYRLNFPLLSDESGKTIKAYGAWGIKQILGKGFEAVLRKTFLIDPNGKIRKEYNEIQVLNHAEEVLKDIEKLSK